MRLTFKGGVHPFEGKEMSKDCPVEKYLPKSDLAYPLSQHIGAPAKPVVAKGDHVLAGQMIAEAGGFVSAPVHASVSGTVKCIEKRLTATGSMVDSIIVENDGLYEEVEFHPVDPASLTREEIIGRIRDGGVVGLGGAGFPTHVKLSPKEPDKIEYILVNGAECEPYLTSDYRRMMDQPEKVVEGLKIVVGLFPNAKGCICIEDNKPDCIARMKELAAGVPNIEVKELMTKYPQGGERTLIYAVTGREINSSMLPADAGCVVDNIDTVVSIYNAVCESTPLIRKIITVTGDAVANPQNYEVRLGTSYNRLIEAAGGFKTEPEKMISGGPMMGQALFSTDFPVAKTSSALTCFTKDEVKAQAPTPCIRCGRCIDVCPGTYRSADHDGRC